MLCTDEKDIEGENVWKLDIYDGNTEAMSPILYPLQCIQNRTGSWLVNSVCTMLVAWYYLDTDTAGDGNRDVLLAQLLNTVKVDILCGTCINGILLCSMLKVVGST